MTATCKTCKTLYATERGDGPVPSEALILRRDILSEPLILRQAQDER